MSLYSLYHNRSNVILNLKAQGHSVVVFMKDELGLPSCQPFDKLCLFTHGVSDGSISQALPCPATQLSHHFSYKSQFHFLRHSCPLGSAWPLQRPKPWWAAISPQWRQQFCHMCSLSPHGCLIQRRPDVWHAARFLARNFTSESYQSLKWSCKNILFYSNSSRWDTLLACPSVAANSS